MISANETPASQCKMPPVAIEFDHAVESGLQHDAGAAIDGRIAIRSAETTRNLARFGRYRRPLHEEQLGFPD